LEAAVEFKDLRCCQYCSADDGGVISGNSYNKTTSFTLSAHRDTTAFSLQLTLNILSPHGWSRHQT